MKISHRRMSAYCGVANAVYCVHNSSAFLLSKAFDHVSQIRMFCCSRQALKWMKSNLIVEHSGYTIEVSCWNGVMLLLECLRNPILALLMFVVYIKTCQM